MKIRKSCQWSSRVVVLAAILSLSALHLSGAGGCGGGGGGGGGAVEGDALAANASSQAITSVAQSVISLMGQQAGLRVSALKAQESAEGEEEFGCSSSTDGENSFTCNCLGGGTITMTFSDAFSEEPCEGDEGFFSGSMNSTFTTTMNDCVMELCGEEVTISGEDSGTWEGSFECDGSYSGEGNFGTAGTCSGMTVTGADGSSVAVGYSIIMSYSGDMETWSETISGSFCTNPPGTPITFSSWEELEEAADPTGTCDAAEEADCVEECVDSCESGEMTDSGGGTAAALKNQEASCEESCADACEGGGESSTADDAEDDEEEEDDTGGWMECTADEECQAFISDEVPSGDPFGYVSATSCDTGVCLIDCLATTDTDCVTHLGTDEEMMTEVGMSCDDVSEVCYFALPASE